jgi:diguanylate cyclase (GGDEF)-like protein
VERNRKGYYQNLKVLFVEDDKFSREKLLRILERRFGNVIVAENGEEGHILYRQKHPDLIIADIKADQLNSLEMIEKIRQQDDRVQIIVTTANEESELLLQLIENNINHFILKPIDLNKFLRAVHKSIVHIELERKLEKQKELNRFLMNFRDDITFVVEHDQIIDTNRAFYAFTGFNSTDSSELINSSSLLPFFVNEPGYFFPNNHEEWVEEFFIKQNGMAKIKWRASSGKIGIYLMKATVILEEMQYLFICTDITNLEMEYKKMEFLVNLDPLTRAYNRQKFSDILSREIEHAESSHCPFSIILLDIDNFQHVNTQYGYQTGDQVLRTLATIVQQLIGEKDVFARWGGTEFILLIPDATKQEAASLAETIRIFIEKFSFLGAELLTCSFGVTGYSHGKLKNQLLKEVDEALLLSKISGENRVHIYREVENENKAGVSDV